MTRLMNSAGDDLCAKSTRSPRCGDFDLYAPISATIRSPKQMVGHIDAEGTLKAAKDVHRLKVVVRRVEGGSQEHDGTRV